jgi:hypothetical protein
MFLFLDAWEFGMAHKGIVIAGDGRSFQLSVLCEKGSAILQDIHLAVSMLTALHAP